MTVSLRSHPCEGADEKDHRGYDSQFTGEVGVGDGLAFVDRALMRKESGWMLVRRATRSWLAFCYGPAFTLLQGMVTINGKFLKLFQGSIRPSHLNSVHLRDFAQTKVNSWIIGTEITGPRVEPAMKRPLWAMSFISAP